VGASLAQVFDEQEMPEGFDYFAFVGAYDPETGCLSLLEGCRFHQSERAARDYADILAQPGSMWGVLRRGEDDPMWTIRHDELNEQYVLNG
jgi:hypothetical protein